MRAYVDSSVILRIVFGESRRLTQWRQLKIGATSLLTRTECLRSIDRLRLRSQLSDIEVVKRRIAVADILDRLTLIPISPPVLGRANDAFPTSLGTLDAIHLSAALLWQQAALAPATFLTHDEELGRAASAMAFEVLGCL